MKKYIIFFGGLSIVIIVFLVWLGRCSYLDTEYIFGWGRFKPFPTEIREKHAVTIQKVDAFITKASGGGEVTSHTEKFNLENYLHVIQIGVAPYLERSDPLDQDVQSSSGFFFYRLLSPKILWESFVTPMVSVILATFQFFF